MTTGEEKNVGDKGDGRRIVRLSFSTFLSLIFLSIVGIALAYIGGVMSGRHMPKEQEEKIVEKRVNPEQGIPKKDEEKIPQNNRILLAEELEFARVLRGEKPIKAEDKIPEKVKKEVPENIVPANKQVLIEQSQKIENTNTAGNDKKEDVNEDGTIYDYVFQIGAFKDENDVDNLRAKLEGLGLRTVMQRSGKLYLVLVRMRGIGQRVIELNEIASKLKLGVPIMLSRKPVTS